MFLNLYSEFCIHPVFLLWLFSSHPSFRHTRYYTLQRKSNLYIPRKGTVWPQSPFPHSCLWAIYMYIFPGSVHIFSGSRIGRPIVGIYKSLTDTWMWKLALSLRNFFSGNICFEFLVLCLCSAKTELYVDISAAADLFTRMKKKPKRNMSPFWITLNFKTYLSGW